MSRMISSKRNFDRSGPSCSAMAVEPATSATSTETILRSPVVVATAIGLVISARRLRTEGPGMPLGHRATKGVLHMFLASIGDTVERGFEVFFAWIPALIGALAILIIGYIIARVLAGLVARVLQRVGLDRTLHSGTAGRWVAKLTASPSRLLGSITFWVVFLGAISLAVTVLGLVALTDFVGAIYAYLPNVLAAILIFVVAGAIAAAV